MKIFLPLLEQISYFEPAKRSRIDSTGQLEVFDLEQSEAKTGAAIERYVMVVQFLCCFTSAVFLRVRIFNCGHDCMRRIDFICFVLNFK